MLYNNKDAKDIAQFISEKETCAVPGVQLTDEIHKVITMCPNLFSSYSGTCKKYCPLSQVCRDYWECKN